jgi:hypothetical protein
LKVILPSFRSDPRRLCSLNHSPGHQAYFTVDEFVCGTCGSLVPCSHDAPRSGPGVLPARLAHLHEFEERDLLAIFSGADSGDICAK